MKSLKEMEEYAKANYVPIIRKANIEFLEQFINEHKCFKILELGTAIGYSAIRMAMANSKVSVTTIERNEEMYLMAKENVEDFGLSGQINLIFKDIFDFTSEDKYDLIFIDAAKAQYIKFFELFKDNLNRDGYIISDNLELKDLQRLTQSKRSKRLVQKMQDYKQFLLSLEGYTTEFIDIGDGFAVTRVNQE